MRKVALAAVVVAFTGSAYAADLPVKAAPPVVAPVVPSWTGFYVGAHFGVGWKSLDGSMTDPNNVIIASPGLNAGTPIGVTGTARGAVGGIHAGYNWQFAPAWVAGIEGDFDGASLNKTLTAQPLAFFPGGAPVPNTSLSMSTDIRWLASVRGRVGYVGWGNTLFYATGGASFADIGYHALEQNAQPTFAANFQSIADFRNTKVGWVAGAGLETMVTPHILLRAEYLYYGISMEESGSANLLPNPGAFPIAFNYNWSSNNIQVVRVGGSVKF